MTYQARIGGKNVKGDFAAISAAWCAYRDAKGFGASRSSGVVIKDAAGQDAARVSYNGNVWPLAEWFPGQEPLLRA